MKKPLPLLALLLASCALGLAAEERQVVVAAGETRATPINALRAQVDIRGRLDESVFLLGGRLRLEGQVSGDVICIGAQVEIGPQAAVGRDLIVIGGALRRDEASRVGGRVYEVRSRRDMRQVAASVLPFLPESGGMTFFKIVKIFFWLLLALLTLAMFPAQVAQASALLGRGALRHLLRGVLAQLALAALLLLFLLLSFVLIGIPLLVVLMAAFFLLMIFGRAALFHYLGGQAAKALRLPASPVLFIVLGVAIYTLLKFVPFAGGVALFILDLFAIGVATGFFIRRRRAASRTSDLS